MTRVPILVAAGFLALIAGGLALEYHALQSEDDALLSPLGRSAAPASPAAAAPALDHRDGLIATIVARPLFSPSRRPPASAAIDTGPATLPRLTGIVIIGSRREVIFAGDAGRPLVATEGSQIGDFVVRSISADRVTVTGPRGARTLRPTFEHGDSGAVAAAPSILDALRGRVTPGFGPSRPDAQPTPVLPP